MDVGVYSYSHGDPLLIDKIVNEFLSQGKFDKLRKECMSDADTKPAYQNLQQRVENTVTQFLKKQVWRPDLNKNQLRDSLRKHILESKFFDAGINRIVDQVVNPNVLGTVFLPEVEEVVYNYLSIPRPSDKNQKRVGTERTDGYGDQRRETWLGEEDHKSNNLFDRNFSKSHESSNDLVKTEPIEEKGKAEEKIKLEPEDSSFPSQGPNPVEKMEITSDESQESLNRMAVEGLRIREAEGPPPPPDSDDSVPLEINEKSMSESRDSEDSIMNQMSPISQGRLTPELEEAETFEEKPQVKVEEEKKPLTFIGRIPKIKREDSESSKSSKAREDTPKKEKLEVKHVYSSDESDSSKSNGKSEKSQKEERKREDLEKKHKEKGSKDRRRDKSKERHRDGKRERSRERHKKSSSSSSSSQRERSSSHHKSSHRHKDSKSKRKEDEKKKSKMTDDHGKEKIKKEDRRSTDRDSNERERDRPSGSRSQGESRRREKDPQKTEEGKGEGSHKEETEVEKEGEKGSESEKVPMDSFVLDFNDLFKTGAVSRFEFPKLTDDFYVKFNSTGFRYFEEWEKEKLDCEEEFKDFVDEAEKDLSLLSDDESEFEFENDLSQENRKTIRNLLKGLGNFRESLMFDPTASEFYRWTNTSFYKKFNEKDEPRERRKTEKNESDESIKENIDRGDMRRAMHLKLLNKYKRKAMRMGKPRRRHRRPEARGIKEKNENRSVSRKRFFNGTNKMETFLPSRVPTLPDCNLVESDNRSVPESLNGLSEIFMRDEGVTLPESPEENEDWPEGPKKQSPDRGGTRLPKSLPLNLPPSPESDDVSITNGISPKSVTVSRKRINKESDEVGTPKKPSRRNYCQKYDSQDLYKPRPILNSSRTRGRERGSERDMIGLDSPVSR